MIELSNFRKFSSPKMAEPFQVLPKTYFEDILPQTGWGLYYKFMIGMACAACFSQAMAFFAMPFSIALSTCEYSITKDTVLNLETSFILGRAIGGFLLNSCCDVYGRKMMLLHTMLMIFVSSFIAAFAYNYVTIIFSAFVLGSGLEGNFWVVRVHLAEILPLKRRGFYLAICDIFWSFGYVLVSLLSVFLKDPPPMTETNAADMKLAYWKMIFAVAGGLNLTVACATALLEESPRFFLHIKKYYLALLTLKQFYAINKSSYGEYLEVKEADIINITDQKYPSIYPNPTGCITTLKRTIKIILNSIKLLFSKEFLRTTIILFIIKLPLLIFGHLNLNILLAKLSHTNSSIREGLEIIHLDRWENSTLCNSMEKNETMYNIYFTLMLGIITGILFVTFFVDYIGRNILLCMNFTLCGACYVAIFYLKNTVGRIILSTVLMASFSAAITTVSVVNIESYPTAIRCTSCTVLNLPILLLGHLVIRCYHLFADYFFMIHSFLFYGAAIATYFVHDLKRKPMIE